MANNNSKSNNVAEEMELTTTDTGIEKTDMTKVNYLLSHPGLLINMLPEDKREQLSAHIGARSMTLAVRMANPRLNRR